jgi:hypothetical protein
MKARTAARLAWCTWAAYLLETTAFIFLAQRNRDVHQPLAANLPILLAFAAFAAIGGLLISRFHRHPIGWIFVTIGLGTALGNLAQQYAIYVLFTEPGLLPGGVAMAWLGAWLWAGSMGSLVFVLLLFPDGKPVSPRWKPVVWVAGAGLAALLAPFLFKTGRLDVDIAGRYRVANPLGIRGWDAFFDSVQAVGVVVYFGVLVVATIGLVIRANRSTGVERQQLKWLGYAAVVLVGAVLVIGPAANALAWGQIGDDIGVFLFGIGVAAIPTAIGVAILKYRLYDIDVIINRTLVYGLLTVVLGMVYVVGVVGVGTLVRQVTGQERNNVVVAASTLAVAALFRPARSRIQDFIDRRFYRRRYDAIQTVESFTGRLRDEVDLDALRRDLLATVNHTLQPAHSSLWLRRQGLQSQGREGRRDSLLPLLE